ncbi:MAG: hypothetical protein ACRC7O_09235 [Fimbriiglobus sp.]
MFVRPTAASVVLDSWAFLQSSGRITLYAFVSMENHVHFVAGADDLAKQVKEFKSYTPAGSWTC